MFKIQLKMIFQYYSLKLNKKPNKKICSKVFPESVQTLFEARHRQSGAEMPGNKIYTLRQQERSLIFIAKFQEICIWEYTSGNMRKYTSGNMIYILTRQERSLIFVAILGNIDQGIYIRKYIPVNMHQEME